MKLALLLCLILSCPIVHRVERIESSYPTPAPRHEWLSGLWVKYAYDERSGDVTRIESTLFVDETQ